MTSTGQHVEHVQRRMAGQVRAFPVTRLSGERFIVGDRLFIANSDPDLVGNIGACPAHYFRPPAFRLEGRT